MSRLLRFLYTALTLAYTPTAPAHYLDLAQVLVERETFTFGIALSGPPFCYRQAGTIHGLEPALAQAVAASHGLQLRLIPLPRAELLTALSARRVDAIATLALDTPPTEVKLMPYILLGDHALTLRGNPFRVTDVASLSGRVAAATAGTSAEQYADDLNRELAAAKLEPMTVHTFSDQRHTAFPVAMGHAAVYFLSTRSALGLSLDPAARTRLVPGLFRPARAAGFAVRPDNEVVFHALEHAIAALVATGHYGELLQQYGLPAELSPYRD